MTRSKADILFDTALKLQQAGRYGKAIQAYESSLKCRPDQASVYNNLGNCLRSLGLFRESLNYYCRALDLEPNRSASILNQSLAYLALNEYEKAWSGYKQRLVGIDFRKEVLTCGKPEWQGQRLSGGERLFVYSNQGIGDELQAMRFIPIVAQQVDHIIWEVHEAVYPLVKDMPMVSNVTVRPENNNRSLPEFDYHCEIFSIASILNFGFDQVPAAYRPPFSQDENICSIITANRKSKPNNKHVGLVWSGNPRNGLNPYRSCGLVHYLPLLEVENVTFYSLQKGAPRKDLTNFSDRADGIVDLADHLPNMASTATAIDELDLLISTDTSVPHLAGSIGAKSWVILHQPADWRWTVDRDSTPWYPQMRLFRQERPHYWISVIEEVRNSLIDF